MFKGKYPNLHTMTRESPNQRVNTLRSVGIPHWAAIAPDPALWGKVHLSLRRATGPVASWCPRLLMAPTSKDRLPSNFCIRPSLRVMKAVIFPDQLRGRPPLANLRSVKPLVLAAEHSQPAVFGISPSSHLFGFRPDSIYRPEGAVSRPFRLLH